MSEFRPTYDDAIDLFDLFQTLWNGKWIISAFVVLATLIGFGYAQVAQPKYYVSVKYTTNIYSVSALQLCGNGIACLESQTIKRFLSLLGDGWSKKNKSSTLAVSISSPMEKSDYDVQIEKASTALTNEVFGEATAALALIQTELTDTLLSTERVATNMLNAKRIIRSIDNGQSVITFGSVSIVKSSPKVPMILVLSVLLGGMVGVLYTLIRNVIAKRKEQLAKA